MEKVEVIFKTIYEELQHFDTKIMSILKWCGIGDANRMEKVEREEGREG